jgi:hypothetical protein
MIYYIILGYFSYSNLYLMLLYVIINYYTLTYYTLLYLKVFYYKKITLNYSTNLSYTLDYFILS